jgi:uncharacterized protein YacL
MKNIKNVIFYTLIASAGSVIGLFVSELIALLFEIELPKEFKLFLAIVMAYIVFYTTMYLENKK